jgi:hypothetical protein
MNSSLLFNFWKNKKKTVSCNSSCFCNVNRAWHLPDLLPYHACSNGLPPSLFPSFFFCFMCKMMGPVLGTKFRFRPDRERPLTISFPEGKKPQQLSSSQREREHRVSRSSSPCCVVLPLQDIMHVIFFFLNVEDQTTI